MTRSIPQDFLPASEGRPAAQEHRARELYHEEAEADFFGRMVGSSPEMVAVKQAAITAARSAFPVLIEGPTGAGKEIVARAIHERSRPRRSFVVVDCTSLPTALFESELFGHVKGAFTNAIAERQGLAIAADGGTLFLDEVGELALENQAKFLRLLQTLEVRPVGCDKQRRIDIRVIAATNRSLRRAVDERRFRDDLYYRLAVIHIQVPPLAQRRRDIRVLSEMLVRLFARGLRVAPPEILPEAYAQLESYDWPGNVRELENVIKRALAELDGAIIRRFQIAKGYTLRHAEPAVIERLLEEHSGNLSRVARVLRVSRPTLYKRLQQFSLDPGLYRRTWPSFRGGQIPD